MAINPNYVTCIIESHEGTVYTGLLSEETGNHITLTLQLGIEQRVPRASIKRREVLPISLMPEGLDQSITPKEMRSLIAFLQGS